MSDLIAFLEARLSEDEEMARSGMSHPGRWVVRGVPGTDFGIPTGISCPAVLLEVETKRRLIETYELAVARQCAEWGDYVAWLDGGHGEPSLALDGPDPKLIPGLEYAIKCQASVYADRPGYKESWRP